MTLDRQSEPHIESRLQFVCEATGADYALFWAQEEDGLCVRTHYNPPDRIRALQALRGDDHRFSTRSYEVALSVGEGAPGRAIANCTPEVIPDVLALQGGARLELAKEFDIRTVVCVPWHGGVLEYGSTRDWSPGLMDSVTWTDTMCMWSSGHESIFGGLTQLALNRRSSLRHMLNLPCGGFSLNRSMSSSTSSKSSSRSSGSSSLSCSRHSVEGALTIFDWDDTLCPTHFMSSQGGDPPEGFHFTDELTSALSQNARGVCSLLSAARTLGQVAIVTLSSESAFYEAAKYWMVGVDFAQVLKDLEVMVVFARKFVHKSARKSPNSVVPSKKTLADSEDVMDIHRQVFCMAKARAMKEALKATYASGPWRNVISIGDSEYERDAIKDLFWATSCNSNVHTWCKTVKMVSDPDLAVLTEQLALLLMWIRSMAAHNADFDIEFTRRPQAEDGFAVMTSYFEPEV